MIPQLISNIILALIAIFVLYTLAPHLRELIDPLAGKKKKKSMSKHEFDDMVKRRAEQLAGKGPSSSQAIGTSKKSTTRDELTSLKEQKIISEEQFKKFSELKKSLQWGLSKDVVEMCLQYNNKYKIELDHSIVIKVIRETLNKQTIINQLNGDKKYELFLKLCLEISAIQIVAKNFDKYQVLLSKKLLIPKTSLRILLLITVTKIQNSTWDKELEKWLEGGSISIDVNKFPINKINSDFCLFTNLKQNVDIIYPLSNLSKENIKSKFPSDKNDKDAIKKKYKRLVTLYHPDKWNYCEKTPVIERKLNMNFNLINEVYNELK